MVLRTERNALLENRFRRAVHIGSDRLAAALGLDNLCRFLLLFHLGRNWLILLGRTLGYFLRLGVVVFRLADDPLVAFAVCDAVLLRFRSISDLLLESVVLDPVGMVLVRGWTPSVVAAHHLFHLTLDASDCGVVLHVLDFNFPAVGKTLIHPLPGCDNCAIGCPAWTVEELVRLSLLRFLETVHRGERCFRLGFNLCRGLSFERDLFY